MLEWVWSFSARPRSAAELVEQRASKLDRMRALLHALGDPHLAFPSLLVAGSKGKGSTVAMLAACLAATGLRTGRYTSPHLINWRERTCINGQPISTDEVIALAQPIRDAVEAVPVHLGQPNTFEVGTAFAFLHFARAAVEVAVVEVGVGGRFDATNVLEPLVSVIAPISYEHTATLGSTLSAIAEHKAGILRPRRPGVLAPQPAEALEVFERVARDLQTPLEEVGRDWTWSVDTTNGLDPARAPIRIESTRQDFSPLRTSIGLLGDHQRDNATAAVAALHALGRERPDLAPTRTAIQAGLGDVDWPGRLQVLRTSPLVVVDGAHNAASAEVLAHSVQTGFRAQRLSLILGLTAGKDAHGVLEALAPRAYRLRLTRSHHERSADPVELVALAREVAPEIVVDVAPSIEAALDDAVAEASPNDLVLVSGSLFLVGEALLWSRRSRP